MRQFVLFDKWAGGDTSALYNAFKISFCALPDEDYLRKINIPMEDNDEPVVPQFDFTSRLYDPAQSKEDNFAEKRNYLIIKIDKDSLQVEDPNMIFDPGIRYFTKVDDIFNYDSTLDVIFIDTHENSAHGVYLKNFRKYQSEFFGCDERVVFEALLVKHKTFGGKFAWSQQQCLKELGIKRSRHDSIVKEFINMGIIETTIEPIPGEQMKNITQFIVNIPKVIELIPQIYDKEVADLYSIQQYIEQHYLGND